MIEEKIYVALDPAVDKEFYDQIKLWKNKLGNSYNFIDGIEFASKVNKLNDEVTNLIKDNGIRNIVFNIKDLNVIDIKGINGLLYNYEISKNNHGRSCICGLKNTLVQHRIKNSRLLKYMYEASDELSAFNVINL